MSDPAIVSGVMSALFHAGYVVGSLAGVDGTVWWARVQAADPPWRDGFLVGYLDSAAQAIDPAFATAVREHDRQLDALGSERRTAPPRRRWFLRRVSQLLSTMETP